MREGQDLIILIFTRLLSAGKLCYKDRTGGPPADRALSPDKTGDQARKKSTRISLLEGSNLAIRRIAWD